MSEKRNDVLILISLFIILFIINYPFLDNALEKFVSQHEKAIVTRIIDGDTIVINHNESVRLLGIDAPERGEIYADESAKFLEEMVFNKTVWLEFVGRKYDRYGRVLAYIHIGNRNVNLEMVRGGFANYYSYDGKDIYHNQFINAWNECLDKNINICEKSDSLCSECIELKQFDYRNEIVVLHNKCGFSCDLTRWELRDEGRKNYFFENFILHGDKDVRIIVGDGTDSAESLYWTGEVYVWTRAGDTLFLRDEKGKLVLWESYY